MSCPSGLTRTQWVAACVIALVQFSATVFGRQQQSCGQLDFNAAGGPYSSFVDYIPSSAEEDGMSLSEATTARAPTASLDCAAIDRERPPARNHHADIKQRQRQQNQQQRQQQNKKAPAIVLLQETVGKGNRSSIHTKNRAVLLEGGANTETSSVWPEVGRVLTKCLRRAGRGGLPGAAAGALQVVTLMWLRTVVNYQCRYGTSMFAAAAELYRQGGILRFYRGVSFALLSNPLSRFGMAAANEGSIALCDTLPRPVSVTFTTWVASLLAGMWRIVLTPLDTCKTVLQVEGAKGFAQLTRKVS